MLHDVFICHASEDKDALVRPLAEALREQHLEVWYDEFSLKVGDSLRQTIERGLAQSEFGIVVLSPSFFKKDWAQKELDGLVTREMVEGRAVVLPIWHEIDVAGIAKHAPSLAGVLGIHSSRGIPSTVNELLKKIRPEESPLVVARNFLLSKKVVPPIISDEIWLDVVEFQEQLHFPNSNVGWRWIFPLPYEPGSDGRERGLNIAWTFLQEDWLQEGHEEKYGPLTHPEKLHKFIRNWPGLFDCCRANPEILALYAPQLTIPGFDEGFADLFDAMLEVPYEKSLHFFSYGSPDTVNNAEPICGEAIAWRHPTFGNYTNTEVASSFMYAHSKDYMRHSHSGFVSLTWTLTDASNWLPSRHRSTLIDGMRKRTYWWSTDSLATSRQNAFYDALISGKPNKFKFTRMIRAGLEELIAEALREVGVNESPRVIAQRFIDEDFVGGYFEEQAEYRRRQSVARGKRKQTRKRNSDSAT